MCPLDGSKLASVPKDVVPESVAALRCVTCGGWWFGADGVFKFAEGYQAKSSYVKSWRKSSWTELAWPALVLTLMIAGVSGGVVLVRDQQRAAIQASYGVRDLVVLDMGRGVVEIAFKANVPIDAAEIRREDSGGWSRVTVESDNGGFKIRLQGLGAGARYLLKVGAKEYRFTVK